jgi:3-oxoacyl-[acyl-carrier-protein] synthase III
MTRYSRITGTGSFLPPRRVTNADLATELAAKGVETSDQWIVERTGIVRATLPTLTSAAATSACSLRARRWKPQAARRATST